MQTKAAGSNGSTAAAPRGVLILPGLANNSADYAGLSQHLHDKGLSTRVVQVSSGGPWRWWRCATITNSYHNNSQRNCNCTPSYSCLLQALQFIPRWAQQLHLFGLDRCLSLGPPLFGPLSLGPASHSSLGSSASLKPLQVTHSTNPPHISCCRLAVQTGAVMLQP